ncbi:MAG: MarR family transcriptional regulator [Clostridiales bacterium]|nr:MarR family transcriptional regulator [Clostridiales bacterium]
MKFHQLTLEIQSLFQSAVINRAKKLNLMPGQPKILDYLEEHNGSSLSEISRGCFLSNPTVTGLIDRMEKTGLIERCHKTGDKKLIIFS